MSDTKPAINHQMIIDLLLKSADLLRSDRDSFEPSRNFEKHPLVEWGYSLMSSPIILDNGMHFIPPGEYDAQSCPLEASYFIWEDECAHRFREYRKNREALRKIFIEINGLQDELAPDIADNDVAVRRADLNRDIRSLISYAVGCMFGRYSLDVPGLVYDGGEWDDSKYSSFLPDADNCIPVTEKEYFPNDIVGRFTEFIRAAYGDGYLEQNLDYISKALGNKGDSSREVIRNYFLNDFYNDHLKIYQNRPIYWLFDSGRQNGFKALMYTHRWNTDTAEDIRMNYLHKMQNEYEQAIKSCRKQSATCRERESAHNQGEKEDDTNHCT